MTTNLLVDTNVLIYALDKNSRFYADAIRILSHPNYNLFLTSKNISEFFAVTSKLKIEPKICFAFYEEVKTNCHILFPSESSLLLFKELLIRHNPVGNQVFDVEIASIMLVNKIQLIATFNQKDFTHIKEIEILNDNPHS